MNYLLINKSKDYDRYFNSFYNQNVDALKSKRPHIPFSKDDPCVFEKNISCAEQLSPLPLTHKEKVEPIKLIAKSVNNEINSVVEPASHNYIVVDEKLAQDTNNLTGMYNC